MASGEQKQQLTAAFKIFIQYTGASAGNLSKEDLGKVSPVLESMYDEINTNKSDTITKREWLEYWTNFPQLDKNDIVTPIVSLAKSCKEEIQRNEREKERQRLDDPTYFPGLE